MVIDEQRLPRAQRRPRPWWPRCLPTGPTPCPDRPLPPPRAPAHLRLLTCEGTML